MAKNISLILMLFLFQNFGLNQIVFEQDIVRGGVTGAGFSTGQGFGSGTFDIHIEDGSTVKKAILFSYSLQYPSSTNMLLNNVPITFDMNTDMLTQVAFNSPPHIVAHPVSIYAKDITNLIDFSVSQFTVEIPNQSNNPGINEAFWTVYLFVVYENQLLDIVNYSVIVTNQDFVGFEEYNVEELNQINSDSQIGFAIYSDRHSSLANDRSIVNFNNYPIGEIYTPDAVNENYISSGVKGHFYYQNGTLYGLDDDIPNNSMSQSDGIANVSEYIENNTTFINFSLRHVLYPNQLPGATNINLAYFLTYSSPCLPFETSLLTSDTTTCTNVPVQLNASGGIAYEWLPQINLSCYDCPNPVFLGDSTINYTVRIWASDSCSKVLPVRVRVFPLPSFESIDVTENICGFEVGAIVGVSTGLSLPHSYQINNSTPQNNFNFSNLEAGIYTITVTDANGCLMDSTVQILEVSNVQAAFSVNPSSGAAPLTVQTQNNSQNATEYQWFWENQISTEFSPSITLDTAGIYTLTLVASNGAAHCNDTTSTLIFVEEPFVVFAYTYVTDEADIYQIYLSGVSEYRYDLYALDGKLVYRQNGNIEAAGYVDLWEISGVASGMYVFRVKVKDANGNEEEIEGKVDVVR